MRRLAAIIVALMLLVLAAPAQADSAGVDHEQCVAAFGEEWCDALEADLAGINVNPSPPVVEPDPLPPIPPLPDPNAPLTPEQEHEGCVAILGEADCHDLECEEQFGLDGCPPSGFHAYPAPPGPKLYFREAKREMRKLFTNDLNELKLRTTINRCHRRSRSRIDCTITLRTHGSVCKSPGWVTESRDGYNAVIVGFKCRRKP